jgi:hypothetical protein
LAALLIIALFAGNIPMSASASVLPPNAVELVRGDDSAIYPNIDEALDAAQDGDTINLTENGAYETDHTILITKGLTFNGNGATITAISGFNASSHGGYFYLITISNDNGGDGSGTVISNLTVDTADTAHNNGSKLGGINIAHVTDIVLTDTTITANRAPLNVNGSVVTVDNVTTDKYASAWYSVGADNGAEITIAGEGLFGDEIVMDSGDTEGGGINTITDSAHKWTLVSDTDTTDIRVKLDFTVDSNTPSNQLVAPGGTATVTLNPTIAFTPNEYHTAEIILDNLVLRDTVDGVPTDTDTDGASGWGETIDLSGLLPGPHTVVFSLRKDDVQVAQKTVSFIVVEETIDSQDKPWPVFEDVGENDWFYNDVYYVYQNDLMLGISDTLFGSDTTLTRAMVVTALGRLYGVDTDDYLGAESAFHDVAAEQYYAPYVTWAAENGIALGYGGGEFKPNQYVKRQEMVAFIMRFVDLLGAELPAQVAYYPFTDTAEIHAYALPYVESAYVAGLVNGRPDGRFAPLDGTLRVELAAVIHRLDLALS